MKTMAKTKIVTEREESEALAKMAKPLIAKLCPNLKNAVIVYVMQTRQNDETGKVVEPKVGECMGKCQAAGTWDRLLYHWDFRITINGNHWAKLDAHQKKALVYHELCHCFMRNGKPSLQKHEFEGFVSELRHFGAWAADLEAVQEVLSPQLSLVEDGEDGEGAVAGATGETPKVATSSQKDGVDSAAMWGTP